MGDAMRDGSYTRGPVEVEVSEQTVEAARMMDEAASIVRLALAKLDVRRRRCGECDGFVHRDLGQARVFQRCDEIPRRLRMEAARLRGEDPSRVEGALSFGELDE